MAVSRLLFFVFGRSFRARGALVSSMFRAWRRRGFGSLQKWKLHIQFGRKKVARGVRNRVFTSRAGNFNDRPLNDRSTDEGSINDSQIYIGWHLVNFPDFSENPLNAWIVVNISLYRLKVIGEFGDFGA